MKTYIIINASLLSTKPLQPNKNMKNRELPTLNWSVEAIYNQDADEQNSSFCVIRSATETKDDPFKIFYIAKLK